MIYFPNNIPTRTAIALAVAMGYERAGITRALKQSIHRLEYEQGRTRHTLHIVAEGGKVQMVKGATTRKVLDRHLPANAGASP